MATIEPIDRVVPITRGTDARELATHAYDRLLELLADLSPDDWQAQTECPAWTVSDMVGHIIGAAKSHAQVGELLRQQLWGARHKADYDGNALDAVNDLQVREHNALTSPERLEALRRLAPMAVRGRMRTPGLMRRLRLPLDSTGSAADGMPGHVVVGHLMDVILTRDIWMHRVDIARATGHELELDPEADGRIVADVVAEWAGRHREPVEAALSGPAGGRYRQGSGGERIEMDAVEFCRALSGRAPGRGLLGTRVVF